MKFDAGLSGILNFTRMSLARSVCSLYVECPVESFICDILCISLTRKKVRDVTAISSCTCN